VCQAHRPACLVAHSQGGRLGFYAVDQTQAYIDFSFTCQTFDGILRHPVIEHDFPDRIWSYAAQSVCRTMYAYDSHRSNVIGNQVLKDRSTIAHMKNITSKDPSNRAVSYNRRWYGVVVLTNNSPCPLYPIPNVFSSSVRPLE